MELWIRSQDKSTLKCVKDVYCNCNNEILVNRNVIDEDYCDFDLMGKYETRERALAILDEIQNLLVPDIKLLSKKINEDQEDDLSDLKTLFSVIQPDGELQIHQLHNVIYQMPQE